MRRRDDGTVLVLIIGVVLVGLLLVAVVVDASRLFLTRRAVTAAADGAALAGAQAVDEAAVYAGATRGGRLPLDPSRVTAAVEEQLIADGTADRLTELRLVRVTAVADTVTVVLTARARLPLVSAVTGERDGVAITVVARARTALVG